MTLSDITKGKNFKIKHIADDMVRLKSLRMGISEGSSLNCNQKIPGGPVIVKHNYQEIAIGRKLADNIEIELYSKDND
ncbi:MAG: ferrous iron transport protein A [Halanaerobiales bacterium]|nr:ferrous iron transport protein A [Halanaerobiales bacterium]MCF8008307.1 ferrous iron transport protein A [Halanaerobiales bacterium]